MSLSKESDTSSFTYFSHLVTTHTPIQHTPSHYKLYSSVILPKAECQYPGVLGTVYFLDGTLVNCYDLRMKDPLCWLYPHQLEGDAGTNFRMGLPGESRSPEVWMWRLYLNLDPLLLLCFVFLMRWVASTTHMGTILFWINRHGQRMWTETPETMNDFHRLSYLYQEPKIWLKINLILAPSINHNL